MTRNEILLMLDGSDAYAITFDGGMERGEGGDYVKLKDAKAMIEPIKEPNEIRIR